MKDIELDTIMKVWVNRGISMIDFDFFRMFAAMMEYDIVRVTPETYKWRHSMSSRRILYPFAGNWCHWILFIVLNHVAVPDRFIWVLLIYHMIGTSFMKMDYFYKKIVWLIIFIELTCSNFWTPETHKLLSLPWYAMRGINGFKILVFL